MVNIETSRRILLCGKYILNIADVYVAATTNYLCINLYIFENLGGESCHNPAMISY